MYRFRLIAGQHIGPDLREEPVEVTNPFTGNKYKRYPSRTYAQGEVVESAKDLVHRFGREKFEYLGEAKEKVEAASITQVPRVSLAAPGGQVSSGYQQAYTNPVTGKQSGGPVSPEETQRLAEEAAEQAVAATAQANAAQNPSSSSPSPAPAPTPVKGPTPPPPPPPPSAPQPVKPKVVPANERDYDAALNKMSVKDLQEHAADEEIDLKGATRREDIIRILKSAQ